MKDCSPSVAPIMNGDEFHMEQCPKTGFLRGNKCLISHMLPLFGSMLRLHTA